MRSLVLLIGIAASGWLYAQPAPPQYGDVTFELVGNGGGPGGGTLEICSVDGGKIYERQVDREAAFHLEYGKHLVQYTAPSSAGVLRYITVDQPKSFVVIPWRLENFIYDGPPAEPWTLQISVKSVNSCATGGSLWAKLVGVYSDYSAVRVIEHEPVTRDRLDNLDRVIESNGVVTFDSLDHGFYLLMILDAEHIRATRTITDSLGKPARVNITLPDCEPASARKP
jgi:hypothetical protein